MTPSCNHDYYLTEWCREELWMSATFKCVECSLGRIFMIKFDDDTMTIQEMLNEIQEKLINEPN